MRWLTVASLCVVCWLGVPQPAFAQSGALKAFGSDKELAAFLKRRAATEQRQFAPPPPPAPSISAPPPSGAPEEKSDDTGSVIVTGARAATPSITNTQEADVDEGGIVKVHGRHLVVLRRGRLFTVEIGDKAMRPIDYTNAFPPGTSGDDAWYDEMLVAGDRVIVVGYSYGRGGTEVNRFRIGSDGKLSFEDSHHLRSNDYYSSTNYASRMIGNTLIFYTPLELDIYEPIAAQLPALRRWTGDTKGSFRRIAPASRVFLPEPVRRDPFAAVDTLHTVTTCDLAAVRLDCRATSVLGTWSSNFYVSGEAVYVWIADAFDSDRDDERALVYRLPLDGSRPGVAQAWGGPVDQFSFREDRAGRALDVVVRADGGGERMWKAEVSHGDAALLRMSLGLFGNGSRAAARGAYRPLPLGDERSWSFHNRFVGRHLVYSAGAFAKESRATTVYAVPVTGGEIATLAAPHGVDRIDIMGTDAVVIGNDDRERLGFSSIELTKGMPRLGDTSFLPSAREGERRSQAFFYRPDSGSADGASGMLGLPITRELAETPVARFLGSGSAVAFLRRHARRFSSAGELVAIEANARDDACEASCVDWYGNARPIFLGERIFGLMGYELVEGRMRGGRIEEVGRVDFAPRIPARKDAD